MIRSILFLCQSHCLLTRNRYYEYCWRYSLDVDWLSITKSNGIALANYFIVYYDSSMLTHNFQGSVAQISWQGNPPMMIKWNIFYQHSIVSFWSFTIYPNSEFHWWPCKHIRRTKKKKELTKSFRSHQFATAYRHVLNIYKNEVIVSASHKMYACWT